MKNAIDWGKKALKPLVFLRKTKKHSHRRFKVKKKYITKSILNPRCTELYFCFRKLRFLKKLK